jgi:hypothetical protein
VTAVRVFLADLAHDKSVDVSTLTVPLNIGYLKAHAIATHGGQVQVRLFKEPEKFLAACLAESPDVVGLTNYGWNVRLNQVVGNYLKRALPQTVVVAGGPNIDGDREAT